MHESLPVVPELRTERLRLRGWCADDLVPFAALNADPVVMEHFPAPLTREESDSIAATARQLWRDGGPSWWAVEVVGGAPFIGMVGLSRVRFDAPFTPAVEVGWRLAREHWGRGYAPEAAGAAIDHGFGALGLEEIVSFTVPANTNSRRVMEKIGMRHDPSGDFVLPSLPDRHPLGPHVLYRISRER